MNFEFQRATIFDIFVALCGLLILTSAAILNVQLISGQLFCLDVFWLAFDFCLFQKNEAKNLYQILYEKVHESIPNVHLPWTKTTFIGATKSSQRCGKI